MRQPRSAWLSEVTQPSTWPFAQPFVREILVVGDDFNRQALGGPAC
jgi:hypothetical protein